MYTFQSSTRETLPPQQREAVLLAKDFKFETVAIIVENNDFGLTFRKNMVALMEKVGKRVVLDVTFRDRNDTNWYATITRIPASKPDLKIVSISAVQAANFVKQYAEAGIATPLFSDYPRFAAAASSSVRGHAGWQDRLGASGLLREDETNPRRRPEGIRLQA